MTGKEARKRGLAWKGDGVKPRITRQQLREFARKHGATYPDVRAAAKVDGLLD